MFRMSVRVPELPPLTHRGRILFALGLMLLLYGLVFADDLCVRAGLVCIFSLALAKIAARINLSNLSCRKQMPAMVCQGEPFARTVHLQNGRKRMHAFEVTAVDHPGHGMQPETCLFPCTPPDTGRSEVRIMHVNRRGTFGPSRYLLSSDFPFGLVHSETTGTHPEVLSVYPPPRLPFVISNLLETGLSQGNFRPVATSDITTEFRSMREYRRGDHKKLISWPVSVRLQELIVKEMETPSPSEVLIIHHSIRPSRTILTPRSFEKSLRLLSGLVHQFHGNSTPFELAASFNAWNRIQVTAGSSALNDLLESLALAAMTVEDTPAGLLAAVSAEHLTARAVLVVSNTPLSHWQSALPALDAPLICIDNRSAWIAATGETVCFT